MGLGLKMATVSDTCSGCPYSGCAKTVTMPTGPTGTCGCEYRDPLLVCAFCGVACPGSARYCRGCRQPLPLPKGPDCRFLSGSLPTNFLFVPGTFHVPPAAFRSFLWSVSETGQVFRLSLTPGAAPRLWSTIGSGAVGFNRFSIVEANFGKPFPPRPLLLTADSEQVWAVSLAEREASILYRAPEGGEIVANTSAAESIRFRGLAVTSDAYAFLLRAAGAQEAVLSIRYFAAERAGDQPIRIGGTSFLGPFMENGLAAICGSEAVAVYRTVEQTREWYEFRNFTPLFSRSSQSLNVPPGGMPLWVGIGNLGLEGRIAGTRGGKTGWLRVFFERNYDEFEPLPDKSCISTASPHGLCVNTLDTIEFLGVDRAPGRYGRLQPAMPVGYSKPNLGYFERSVSHGKHEITVSAGVPLGLTFEDPECDANSCCGLFFSESNFVVTYIVPSKSKTGRGLKVAHWGLLK
jgi:hypothetical protein